MPLIRATTFANAADDAVEKVELQPASLDAKSRQIQRQGAFQAALQSMGVVQHASGSFEDYLALVQKAAEAELRFINA